MYIRELNIYRHLIPGLIAGTFGYSVYVLFLHTSFQGIYKFPSYASPHVVDLIWTLLVGIFACFGGMLFKVIFGFMHIVFGPLNKRPIIRAIIGGVALGAIGSLLPLTLYSGQNQLLQIIHNPVAFGVGLLLLMMLVKILLTSTSFATGFEGGPIFPILFMGGTLGLALSKSLAFIPEGVGVLAGMAGFACSVAPLPLTIILLLGLLGGQADLTPIIVIGAITGLILSKVLTSYLPKRDVKSAASGDKSQSHASS